MAKSIPRVRSLLEPPQRNAAAPLDQVLRTSAWLLEDAADVLARSVMFVAGVGAVLALTAAGLLRLA